MVVLQLARVAALAKERKPEQVQEQVRDQVLKAERVRSAMVRTLAVTGVPAPAAEIIPMVPVATVVGALVQSL